MSRKFKATRISGSICLAALLSACAFGPFIESNSAEFNKRTANSANQQVLLNILRASDNRPLHFTQISQLRGSYTGNVGADLSFSFVTKGEPNTETYAPSTSLSTNPSFDLAVLNSKEFYNGILTPISLELFEYFANSGVRGDLLFYMLVEEIRHNGDIYRNRPGSDSFCKFQNVVDLNFTSPYWITSIFDKKPGKPTSFPIDTPSDETLASLPDLEKSGYSIKYDDEQKTYRLIKKNQSVKIKLILSEDTYEQFLDVGPGESDKPSLVLRSPAAVFDYLGELLNRQNDFRFDRTKEGEADGFEKLLKVCRDIDDQPYLDRVSPREGATELLKKQLPPHIEMKRYGLPQIVIFDEQWGMLEDGDWPILEMKRLFNLTKSEDTLAGYSVNYRGDNWGVAVDGRLSGRSTQALWLLTQLVGLQSSVKDAPSTVAVDIVN